MNLSFSIIVLHVVLSSTMLGHIGAKRVGQKYYGGDNKGSIPTSTTTTTTTGRNNSSRLAEKRRKRNKFLQQHLLVDFPNNNKPPLIGNPFSPGKGLDNNNNGGIDKEDRRRSLQNEEEEKEEGRVVIVECSEEPLFKCPSCAASIEAEQESVLSSITVRYPGSQLITSTQRLVNAIYVRLPAEYNNITGGGGDDDSTVVDTVLRHIEGVKDVTPHGNFHVDQVDAVDYLGGFQARDEFCATGKDVRVAVLDSGIDYTHYLLGGPGTRQAYLDAYGTSARSEENRIRGSYFPTNVVVDGYDFTGEFSNVVLPDDDPIDSFGHGTAVSHAILRVAPGAKLIGLKVCSVGMACPVFAMIQGLEFALDPNGDGNTDDKVDIINLSLGVSFMSPFYNFVTAALETVFELGVLPVISAGNSGNVPYVMGGLSGGPNSIVVGATGSPDGIGVMASYSSRGPGGNSMMKPDIVAPSGLALAAVGTGVYRYRQIMGTSFSAPLVAGAAAVVKERCPNCSPFAIKSLLMNNAKRSILYHNDASTLSPVTLSGSGEMQVNKTLQADFWAYSLQDVQPSLSLGVVDAADDVAFRRTIKVINLSGMSQSLQATFQFRDPNHPYGGALRVDFNPSQVDLPAGCNGEAFLEVIFSIDASSAPPNHMTSTGTDGFDPQGLDMNEFGGHVILSSSGGDKDISLPFVSIIRQASNVTIETPVIRELSNEEPTNIPINLTNHGAGKAQIDAFQLLVISEDDEEGQFGEPIAPNDFRYIGYRVLKVGNVGCTHLLEFAFNTWERQSRLVTEFFGVELDVNGDDEADLFLHNSGLGEECFVQSDASIMPACTGLPPDHATSSATTVLRACSEDLGLEAFEGSIGVRFEALTISALGELINTDSSSESFISVDFPQPRLEAPSYDVFAGQTLETLQVDGTGGGSRNVAGDGSLVERPLGLMLVTNAYRNPSNTGASIQATEALVVRPEYNAAVRLPVENTVDVLKFPQALDLAGPDCSWKDIPTECVVVLGGGGGGDNNDDDDLALEVPEALEDSIFGDPIVSNPVVRPMITSEELVQQQENGGDYNDDGMVPPLSCPLVEVPRASVILVAGPAPTPTRNGAIGGGEEEKDEVVLEQREFVSSQSIGESTGTASTPTSSSQASPGRRFQYGVPFLCVGFVMMSVAAAVVL